MSKIFAYIPSAYKVGKTYSAIPNDGSGDFTFSRPEPADRVDENRDTESMAINVPRIDYADEGCPKLLLDNSITERCSNNTISIDANSCVWEIELEATADDNSIRRVQLSDATDNYMLVGYGSSSSSIVFTVYDGTTTSALSYINSDIVKMNTLKGVKNGTEQIFKVNNVIVGYLNDSPVLNTMTRLDYSNKGTSFYMDGKTRENTIDDDVTTFDSTATSWTDIINDELINNSYQIF